MRAVLTGMGFIGTHLYKRLSDDGVQVYHIPHDKLHDKVYLKDLFSELQDVDIIVHMASYGNLAYQIDVEETVKANIVALVNLLEATRAVNYRSFINFSSSSTLLPTDTMYSVTKRAGEDICKVYAKKYNKPIISVLPYTVIGLGEPREHLIPQLIESCLFGKKIPFVSRPVHDFIGVNDFIEAIKLLIEKYYRKDEVEIGTGKQLSNEQILKMVEKATGKSANIERTASLRSYDTGKWVANPVIIKSIGWKQKQTIQQVIDEMVKTYENKKRTNT